MSKISIKQVAYVILGIIAAYIAIRYTARAVVWYRFH